MSCAHRTAGRWGRVWSLWLIGAAGSFAVAETVALATDGVPATLSAYLRRGAGLEPVCDRHGRVGRGVIVAACTWAALHLAYGVLGLRGRRVIS